MRHYTYRVHGDHDVIDGRAMAVLWPQHKPLNEVLKLRDTTPELIWQGTYQGNPTPAGGYTFRRDWWSGVNRYHENEIRSRSIGRFQSWDTAETTGVSSAWTVGITGEITADYRLVVRDVYRDRLTFDVLPATIESVARRWNTDGRLNYITIEDKSSGKAANQTLKATSPEWLRDKISPYQPVGSKEQRASSAAVWCRNGMVLLPHPGPAAPWLLDFEDELFSFPQSAYADQVDAFSQLILFLENYLAAGHAAGAGKGQ